MSNCVQALRRQIGGNKRSPSGLDVSEEECKPIEPALTPPRRMMLFEDGLVVSSFRHSLRRAHSANIRKGRLLHDLSVKTKVVFSHSARRETSLKFVAHATTV